MSQSTLSTKNHDIEVLRTVAIAFVIFAHVAALLSPDSMYWRVLGFARFGSGVDLFFCVSGFIITSSIISTVPERKNLASFMSFAIPFWKRRFWRLMPSAFFWVFVMLLISYVWGGKGQVIPFEIMYKSAFHALTQTQNFYFIDCRPAGSCGELGIYWSLSLENQFYFALPILAFLLPQKKLAAFFFLVFLSQFFLPRTLNESTPFMWPLRTDAIALGVIIALFTQSKVYRHTELKSLKNGATCTAIFLFSVLLLALLSSPRPIISFSVGITALVSGFLVLLASYNNGYFSSRKSIRRFCDYIGSRSYSIYLTHIVGLSLTKIIFFSNATNYDLTHTTIYLAFFFLITLFMSEINYRVIEMPLRNYGRNIVQNRKVVDL